MSSRLAALSAAAITTAVVAAATAHAQDPGGRTLTFRELDKGSTFHYVDNAPRTTLGKNGPKRISAGDELVFVNPLRDASGPDGHIRVDCKATSSSAHFAKAGFLCNGAADLRDGTLFFAVSGLQNNGTHGAVVGGTGAYVGARGSFTNTSGKSGSTDVVTLLP